MNEYIRYLIYTERFQKFVRNNIPESFIPYKRFYVNLFIFVLRHISLQLWLVRIKYGNFNCRRSNVRAERVYQNRKGQIVNHFNANMAKFDGLCDGKTTKSFRFGPNLTDFATIFIGGSVKSWPQVSSVLRCAQGIRALV